MTFEEWWESAPYSNYPEPIAEAAWLASRKAALDEAANYMLSRKVMASEVYANAILALKEKA